MPTITNTEYTRLLEAEKMLQDMRDEAVIEPFVRALADDLLLGLMMRNPPDKWPSPLQRIWESHSKSAPNAAALLLGRYQAWYDSLPDE